MMYAQYLRIEARAQRGVFMTVREFIRAAHECISDTGKARELRDSRHAWLREGLVYRDAARSCFHAVTLGHFGGLNADQIEAEAEAVKATLNPVVELYTVSK